MKAQATNSIPYLIVKAVFCLALVVVVAFSHLPHSGISIQTAHAVQTAPDTSESDPSSGDQSGQVDQNTQGDVQQTLPTGDVSTGTSGGDTMNDTQSDTQTVQDQTQTKTQTDSNSQTNTDTDTANATTGTSQLSSDAVSVTANGVAGTLTVDGTQAFEVDWISQNATNCTLSLDGTSISGVASDGSLGPINSTHPYYPAAGASHTFTISCEGLSGPVSGQVIVTQVQGTTTGPSQIADPQLTATTGATCGGTVDLTWNSVSSATSYIIFRDNSQIAQVGGTSFTDTGIAPTSSHTYSVEASNGTQTSVGHDQSVANASDVCGGGAPQGSSSVDITVSGSQGPLTLTPGESFTVDWISQNATNCTVSSDNFSSGVPSQGTLGVIDQTHAYYPTASSSRTFNINCEGLSGQVSDSVTVINPALAVPEGPSAPVLSAATGTACGGTVDLTWNSITGATSYTVFRDGSQIAQISGNTFTDSGLNVNESHTYTVRTVSATGTSIDSNVVTAISSNTCNTVGGNPQSSSVDITASGSQGPLTLTQGESFTIDWISQNATNCTVSSANVFSSAVASNGSLGTISPTHPYYPPAGGSRTFTIVCEGLQGQISDSVTVILPALPQPPAVPTISNIATTCDGTVTLTISPVTDATSYKIFRNGTLIGTATTTTFTDSHLSAGTLYSYTVEASNANGDSAMSGSVSTTIPTSCVAVPTAPTIFAATGTTCGGTIFVSWNAVSTATSYNVFRNGTLVGTSSNVSFTDAGLTPGQSYSYTVSAVNSAGTSVLSNAASATASAACVTVPNAPVLTATTGTACGGTVDLTWNAVSGAGSYNVYRNGTLITSTSNNSYTDTGLSVGTSYVYTVKAVNSAGESAASNPQTVNASTICPLPTPTVSLTANPGTISQGQNSTLTWTSTNATSCAAGFTTSTLAAGTANVSPATTTTYSIICTNGTNNATATATVTVNAVIIPPACTNPVITSPLTTTATQGQNFSYTLSANSSTTVTYTIATSSLPAGLSFSGNTNILSGTPSSTGVFSIPVSAANDCGTTTITLVVTVNPANNGGGGNPDVTVSLTANPDTIAPSATSTLTWNSTNATSCSALWTDATSTSGSQIVSPATTTAYSIMCSNATKSGSATTTVTVSNPVLPPACTVPVIDSSLTATGVENAGFSYTLTATNASTTATFSIGTSTLPAGLSISGATISGTPTVTGTFSIPVSAVNTCGTDAETLTITITPPNNGGGGGPVISVTLTANPDTIAPGATSTLTWTSMNALSCSADFTSATSTSGSQDVAPTSTTAYVMNCVNGSQTASSTATVTVTTPTSTTTPPGGGGGGGGCGTTCNSNSGGGGGFSSGGGCGTACEASIGEPVVLGATAECDYLHDYLHIGWPNDPVEVIKLQLFLKDLEGFSNLQVTGIFDQATFDAVSAFQVRYQPDILTPWGYAQGQSTGYVYILTKKKVNEIFCNEAFPLNTQQEQEIAAFRALMEGLRQNGITIPGVSTTAATNPADLISGVAYNEGSTSASSTSQNGYSNTSNLEQVAAAIFAGPESFGALIAAILVILAIVLAAYGIAHAVVDQKKYEGLSKDVKQVRTIFIFIGVLIAAVILAFVFGYFVIILPLLFLIIIMSAVVLWVESKRKTPPVTPVNPVPAPTKVIPPTSTNTEPIILAGKTEVKEEIKTPDYSQK